MCTHAKCLQKVGTYAGEWGSTSSLEAALRKTGISAPCCPRWVQEEGELSETGVQKCQYNVSHNIWTVNLLSLFIFLQTFCISHLNP